MDNNVQFIAILAHPPKDLLADRVVRDQFALYSAVVLDFRWKKRNEVVFQGCTVNLIDILIRINSIFHEHWVM